MPVPLQCPKTPNQRHQKFTPHSSLAPLSFHHSDTEQSSHKKPFKGPNHMPITISKQDLIKMTVCMLTEALWPPRVLDDSHQGLNGASVAGRDCWPLSAFLHNEPNLSPALSGIISHCRISQYVSTRFACFYPEVPEATAYEKQVFCTSHVIYNVLFGTLRHSGWHTLIDYELNIWIIDVL